METQLLLSFLLLLVFFESSLFFAVYTFQIFT